MKKCSCPLWIVIILTLVLKVDIYTHAYGEKTVFENIVQGHISFACMITVLLWIFEVYITP